MMFGVYINLHDPFGKHFIGSSNTLTGIRALVVEQTRTSETIGIAAIRHTLSVTESYYQLLENGVWFVVMPIQHREEHQQIRRILKQ